MRRSGAGQRRQLRRLHECSAGRWVQAGGNSLRGGVHMKRHHTASLAARGAAAACDSSSSSSGGSVAALVEDRPITPTHRQRSLEVDALRLPHAALVHHIHCGQAGSGGQKEALACMLWPPRVGINSPPNPPSNPPNHRPAWTAHRRCGGGGGRPGWTWTESPGWLQSRCRGSSSAPLQRRSSGCS